MLLLAACTVNVREQESGEQTDVDVSTPLGGVSVRTNVEPTDTGLPVYPGARLLREDGEPESARVNIGTSLFGVKVVAASFEGDDAPERIVDFYKNEMRTYGSVTECRGDIDFRGQPGAQQATCKERPTSREIQLVVGTEERHRIVAVKPRGGGSEFALVYIQTR